MIASWTFDAKYIQYLQSKPEKKKKNTIYKVDMSKIWTFLN